MDPGVDVSTAALASLGCAGMMVASEMAPGVGSDGSIRDMVSK